MAESIAVIILIFFFYLAVLTLRGNNTLLTKRCKERKIIFGYPHKSKRDHRSCVNKQVEREKL